VAARTDSTAGGDSGAAASNRFVTELQHAPHALHAIKTLLLGLVWRLHCAIFLTLLPPLASLTSLDVSSSGFDDDCASVLASWDGSPRLRHLNISDNNEASDVALSGVMAACRNVESLLASRCARLARRSGETIATTLRNVVELRLDGCASLGGAALKFVLHALSGHLQVCCCDALAFNVGTMRIEGDGGGISGVPHSVCNMSLTELDVSHCADVDDEVVSSIGAGCRGLRTLRFADCPRVTAGAVFAVGELCVDMMTLDCSGCTSVRMPFAASMRVSAARRAGRYRDGSAGVRFHQHFEFMSNVAAGGGLLLDAEVQWLAVSAALTSIDLDGAVGLTDSAFASVALSPKLTRVSVHGLSQLTDATLSAVSRQCTKLQHLDMGACPRMTMQGIAGIVAACTELRALDCSVLEAEHVNVTEATTESDDEQPRSSLLHLLAVRCPLLARLDVSGRDLLEPATRERAGDKLRLAELLQPLQLLRVTSLAMRGCTLDGTIVGHWVRSCPSLTALDLCHTQFDGSEGHSRFCELVATHPLRDLWALPPESDIALTKPIRGACAISNAVRLRRRIEREQAAAAGIQARYRLYLVKRGSFLWLMRVRKQRLRQLLRRASAGAIARCWKKCIIRHKRTCASRRIGLAWRWHRTRLRIARRVAERAAAAAATAERVAGLRAAACRRLIRVDGRGCVHSAFGHWYAVSESVGRLRRRVGGRHAGIGDLEKRTRTLEYAKPSDVHHIDPRGAYARYTQRNAFLRAPPPLVNALAHVKPPVKILNASLRAAVAVSKAVMQLELELTARQRARQEAAQALALKIGTPAFLRQLKAVDVIVRACRSRAARLRATRWRRAEFRNRTTHAQSEQVRGASWLTVGAPCRLPYSRFANGISGGGSAADYETFPRRDGTGGSHKISRGDSSNSRCVYVCEGVCMCVKVCVCV
jgi:hypothetical protein